MPPIVNPFAQINASLPPLVPNPADLAPPVIGGPDDGTQPAPQKISAAAPSKSPVWAPSKAQQAEEQAISGRLEGDYQKDLHPWGTPENHPGVWGKIGHAISVATGGPNRRLREEAGLENRENSLATQEQENELRAAQAGEAGARTGLTQEQTKEMPEEATSKERLEGAQADKLENPADKYTFQQTDHGLMRIDSQTGAAEPVTYNGQPLSPYQKPEEAAPKTIDILGPDHKEHEMGWDAKTGKYDTDEGVKGEKPTQAPGVTVVVPDGQGGGKVERLTSGQSVAPGSMSATQFGGLNTATAATRTMAETAPKVIDLATRVGQLVDQQQKILGPAASRWQEFMAGKVGAPNPEFTKLRTDVGLLQTALMRMHVGARGGEKIMEHFADLIDASKQDPENLKAALGEITAYANSVAQEAHPGAGGQPQGGGEQRQRPANVPEGYVFRDGPKGKGWYAPAAK